MSGQQVTVHVDALNADISGKAWRNTRNANTARSAELTASGNLTKNIRAQRLCVSRELGNQPLLLGANVEVKIRVAD